MKDKSKQKKLLRETLKSQIKQFKITDKFSYKFDHRSDKLILCYSIPKLVQSGNKIKSKSQQKERYIHHIDINNWKKFFKGSNSIVKDHSKWVTKQKEEAEVKRGVGDEYEFRWWIETFLIRTVGHTKIIKKLSPSTIKQNKFHLNEYFNWLVNEYPNATDMFDHIDNGKDWFEEYYKMRLNGWVSDGGKKVWSPATIGIAFRNIRGFYNYVADNHKDDFPYDLLKRVKVPTAQNNRDQLNEFEFNKIIDFIITKEKDDLYGKFILMLRLQMKSGMRVEEVCEIRNRNIDVNNKVIKIIGKGDKQRTLNFGDEGDKKIWDLIVSKMSDAIFLFYRTKIRKYPSLGISKELDVDKNLPTTTSYYLQRFREMRTMLGLRDNTTSHSVRRYFITQFLKSNPNRDLVRQIVGHSSTRMTDYYMGDMIDPKTKTTLDLPI